MNANKCEAVSDLVNNCSEYTPGAKCILCNPGKYTKDGACSEDLDATMYYSSFEDKAKGLICKTGHTMDEERKCVANSSSSSSGSRDRKSVV